MHICNICKLLEIRVRILEKHIFVKKITIEYDNHFSHVLSVQIGTKKNFFVSILRMTFGFGFLLAKHEKKWLILPILFRLEHCSLRFLFRFELIRKRAFVHIFSPIITFYFEFEWKRFRMQFNDRAWACESIRSEMSFSKAHLFNFYSTFLRVKREKPRI